jgi:arylsulfatase A-like enzyme
MRWIFPTAATATLAALAVGLVDTHERQPNVILVLVDTLRADHLSAFGYSRRTSPEIDALAERGVAFSGAISQAPYTSKSIEALFTGDLPSPAAAVSTRELPEWRETLAEHFHAAGYQTGGFSGNPLVSRTTGYAQGFDTFEMESLNYRPAVEMFEAALGWLGRRDRGRPFFLYVHCMDVHAPYAPPESDDLWRGDYEGPVERKTSSNYVVGIREAGLEAFERETAARFGGRDLERLVSLYDASIHYFDRVFGAFYRELESSGRLRDTIVVLVADHGEEFMEHGSLGHGRTLFDHQVRVPLLVWGPGIPAGVRVDAPVAVADIMPTLLDLVDLPRAETGYGESLRPLWQRNEARRATVASVRPSTTTPILIPTHAAPEHAAWLPGGADAIADRLARIEGRARERSGPENAAPTSPMLTPEIEAQLQALGYAVEH